MQGLEVLDFDPARVIVNQRVMQWMSRYAEGTQEDPDSDEEYWACL
ncbi:hypothetical protein EW026_g1184 [Hermanssonia centrifuga]|nr:hypothetical protein EW026_g1184 [Hermanssonia centrifuga]